jgi:uncharacterized membrane-anchored protein
VKLSKSSVALLLIQLVLVSSIAVKYLYQRSTCPRVWVRTVAYDPEMVMRGRYLSLRLTVDGCQSTLPTAFQARFPRNIDGTTRPNGYSIQSEQPVRFSAKLKVEGDRLLALRIEDADQRSRGVQVVGQPGSSCDALRLEEPVDFYIAEHAASPLPVKSGQELWMEVTIPPQGPPRPIQLALKDGSAWRPLAFQ